MVPPIIRMGFVVKNQHIYQFSKDKMKEAKKITPVLIGGATASVFQPDTDNNSKPLDQMNRNLVLTTPCGY